MYREGVLGGKGLVVHEKEVNIGDVVDEESLVAGRHHVACLPVGAVSDLIIIKSAPNFPHFHTFVNAVSIVVYTAGNCSYLGIW